MSSGKSSNGDGGGVRVLPPDTPRPHRRRDSDHEPGPGRWAPWAIALVVAVGVLAVATLGGDDDSASTAAPPPTAATNDTSPISAPPATNETEAIAPIVGTDVVWSPGVIEQPGSIVGAASGASRIIAVADDDRTLGALSTTNGGRWRTAEDARLGEGVFFDVIAHQNGFLALTLSKGAFVTWTSPTGITWSRAGEIEGRILPTDAALASDGTTALMVAFGSDGLPRLWTSTDGSQWESVAAPSGLGSWRDPVTAASHGGHFYVAGRRCADETCRPAIVRSADAVDWETVIGPGGEAAGAIDLRPGGVDHLAATDGGIVAVGHVLDDGAPRPVVWLGAGDGRVAVTPTPGPIAPPPIEATIAAVETDPSLEVRLVIGGAEYTLAPGESVSTANGIVEIGTFTNDSVEILAPDGLYILQAGDEFAVRPLLAVMEVAAIGRRLVAVGLAKFDDALRAVAWTSVDGGLTWNQSDLPGGRDATARHVAVRGHSIAILGTDDAGARAWSGEWRTESDEFLAERTTRRFVDAVFSNDADAAVRMLEPGDSPAVAALPTLIAVDIGERWWGEASGTLDRSAVADTLAYLAGTEAATTVGECRASVDIGAVETAVACEYSAGSRLHTAFGLDEVSGTLRVTVRNDLVAAFDATDELIAGLWDLLARWTADAHPQLLDSVLGSDETLTGPVLDAETAPIHVALAEEMASTWLAPGSSTVTDSPVGPIEWRWLEQPLGPDISIGEVITTAKGFVASSYSNRGPSQPGLWTSRDGLTWEELPAPRANWLFNLHEFGDGLIVNGDWQGVPQIWAQRGDGEWTAVTLPINDAAPQGPGGIGLEIMGVTAERALVRSLTWGNEGLIEQQRFWAIDANLIAEELAVPAAVGALDEGFVDLRAVGGDDSITLLASRSDEAPSLWRTTDLRIWESIGSIPELTDVIIALLVRDGDRHLVVALRENLQCADGPAGDACTSPAEVWESVDGGAFRLISEFDYTAYLSAGHGDLGIVTVDTLPGAAFSGPEMRPLRFRFSPDGAAWIDLPRPMPFDPQANWLWVGDVAVGGEHLLMSIESDRSRRPGDFHQVGTLLVGSLIDP